MPFEFEISSVEHHGSDLHVFGRITHGAYFGPELVTLISAEGVAVHAQVQAHGIQRPQGWPVLPDHHNTVVELIIASPAPHFRLDVTKPIVGAGALVTNGRREDITRIALADPRFWALQLGLHAAPEDAEDTSAAHIETDDAAVNAFFEDEVEQRWRAGIWPYIRVAIGPGRSIELELAGGTEPQDRYWLCDETRRVLIGYHSGHFSLPAVRPQEVTWVADQLAPEHRAFALLLMTTCYIADTEKAQLRERLGPLHAAVPGARESDLVGLLLEGATADVSWGHDAERGWTNDGRYSQRNPNSPLSVLTPGDFRFIQDFFRPMS